MPGKAPTKRTVTKKLVAETVDLVYPAPTKALSGFVVKAVDPASFTEHTKLLDTAFLNIILSMRDAIDAKRKETEKSSQNEIRNVASLLSDVKDLFSLVKHGRVFVDKIQDDVLRAHPPIIKQYHTGYYEYHISRFHDTVDIIGQFMINIRDHDFSDYYGRDAMENALFGYKNDLTDILNRMQPLVEQVEKKYIKDK